MAVAPHPFTAAATRFAHPATAKAELGMRGNAAVYAAGRSQWERGVPPLKTDHRRQAKPFSATSDSCTASPSDNGLRCRTPIAHFQPTSKRRASRFPESNFERRVAPERRHWRKNRKSQLLDDLSVQECSGAWPGSSFALRAATDDRDEGVSPSTSSSTHDPEATAMEIERLQEELKTAVAAEDYNAAAGIRDKLRRLQEDEEAGVVGANALFYRAFASADMRRMRRLWLHSDHVQCIHPGSSCIQGYDMVMESWDVILSGTRDMSIDVEDVRCYVRGGMAFVTCIEVLRAGGSAGRIIATNIFEKRDGQWLMVHHQGAPAPTSSRMGLS